MQRYTDCWPFFWQAGVQGIRPTDQPSDQAHGYGVDGRETALSGANAIPMKTPHSYHDDQEGDSSCPELIILSRILRPL